MKEILMNSMDEELEVISSLDTYPDGYPDELIPDHVYTDEEEYHVEY